MSSLIQPLVTSITGTSNQVNASASTGAVTLSTPQSIATSSSPTFAGLTLTGAANVPVASSAASLDSTGATALTVANNASSTIIGSFGGLLVVHAVTVTGDSAIFLCPGGGGATVLVSQTGATFSATAATAGKVNIYNNAGTLTLENKNGSSIDFRIIALRTR